MLNAIAQPQEVPYPPRVQNRSFLEKDGETLFQAYSQGAIPLAQFVEQANARLKLMALETN